MAQEPSLVSWVPSWCSSTKQSKSSPTVVMEMPPQFKGSALYLCWLDRGWL